MADTFQRIIVITGFLLVILLGSAPFFQDTSKIDPYSTKSNLIFQYSISGAKHPNKLDTFRGIFKKDMVDKDPVQTKLDFTQEEMDEIVQKMLEIGFFSYPKNYQPTIEGEIIGFRTPYSVYYLEYHDESGTQVVRWSDQYTSTKDPEFYDLNQLARLIISTIQAKPEFQKLPKPTSGYM